MYELRAGIGFFVFVKGRGEVKLDDFSEQGY